MCVSVMTQPHPTWAAGEVLGPAPLPKPRQTLGLQRCPLEWDCLNAAGELADVVVKGAMGQRCRCSTPERGETPMLNSPQQQLQLGPGGSS